MKPTHADLISSAGGTVEGIFVRSPGVSILAKTEITDEAVQIFRQMNCSSDEKGLAEFNSRITYLSFREVVEEDKTEAYLNKIIGELQHRSVLASYSITYLLAGVSVECCLELCAHREASVARLTSSRTKAHESPLFVCPPLQGDQESLLQAAYDNRITTAKSKDALEIQHRGLPASKAVSLTWTMNLKDLHKFFSGRFSPEGVEKELQDLIEIMCQQAHDAYPWAILTPQQYKALHT